MRNLVALDEAQHSKIIKGIGSAFTQTSMLDFEDAVDHSTTLIISTLFKSGQEPVDITRWLQLFAMDVLNRVAFGESLGNLDKVLDVDGLIEASEKRNRYWYAWAAIPNLEYLINKSSIPRRMRTPISALGRIANQKLRERQLSTEQQRPRDLLQKYLEAQSRFPNDIDNSYVAGLVATSIAAGADTVATTLTATLIFVLQNPTVQSKLLKELTPLGPIREAPRWSEVCTLPYLDATIKESLRYFPVIAFGMDRVLPDEGMSVSGTFLPGGTIVSCHSETIHQDVNVYGHDANLFRPERWLEASEEQLRQMNKYFLGFGHGKRMCIGRHLALLEMKKTLPLILKTFDVCCRSFFF